MRIRPSLAVAAVVVAMSGFGPGSASADVVVLKGGTVVPLKQPWVRRGNTAYMTRPDGTLLSVPVSEIDRDATARANQAAAAAPAASAESAAASTPADAARAKTDSTNPKAKVKITDADVSHPLDLSEGEAPKDEAAAATTGGSRIEVADYTQEQKGDQLIVKGTLRNSGQGPAENVRMTVTAIDEKGQSINASSASLSKGSVGSGQSVDFQASLEIGQKTVATVRFNPQWTPPKPPPGAPGQAGAGAAANAAAGAGARPNQPPRPTPTPYGRGNIYAAPAPSAPLGQAPADGSGYIPNPSSPDNQPKPPSR